MTSITQPLEFRPFTMGDYDAVVAFWKMQEGVGLGDSDARDCVSAYLHRNPGMSFVVREADKVIAAVLCGHDGRRGYLHHLAVAHSHRKRGIGADLVRLCLQQLQEAGIKKCNIFLFTDNVGGEGFWRAIGFANRGDLKIMQRCMSVIS